MYTAFMHALQCYGMICYVCMYGCDVCNFNVPLFKVKQKLRVRIKIHQRKNKEGFCNMSVIASCLPCDISTLEPSLYSLDNIEKLPKNLKYKRNKEIEV